MDDALAGTRVLIAGGEADAARPRSAARHRRRAGHRRARRRGRRAGRARRPARPDRRPRCGGGRVARVARPARPAQLESALAAQTVGRRRDVEALRVETLRRLALAARLGRRLGLSELAVTHIRHAAPLHDVGKIAIPDSILLKPRRLSAQEFEVVKTHAEAGARVLADSESEVLETAESIARSHHERWDGSGYPGSLAGARIPPLGRRLHLARAVDILLDERPHKEALTLAGAAAEITRGGG